MVLTALTDLPCVRSACEIEGAKLIKVLLINPNSSESMTLNALKMVQNSSPLDTIVYGYTGPQGQSPTAVEGHLDSVLSAATVMRDAHHLISQADACLVACFSDHPLTNCIREEFNMPTCGILEAAVYSARALGGRFGVIATVYRSEIRHADAIRNMGLQGHCAGVRSTGLAVAELETKPRLEVLQKMGTVAIRLVEEQDADVLVLGCCGMADMKQAVEVAVKSSRVPVIDGVVAGVNFLSGLVRLGATTSKRGVFSSASAARNSRHQDYM